MSETSGDPGFLGGLLVSVQTSRGGVPKTPVLGPVLVTPNGVAGDRQRDLRFHGGPDRAVCLFSLEIIEMLRMAGHPIAPGTTGENFTISGIPWERVLNGSRLRVGECELEITRAASPCKNIAGSFSDGDFSRLSSKLHPGQSRMYARVLREGFVSPGDPVALEPAALSS